jgi:hypothetical protein
LRDIHAARENKLFRVLMKIFFVAIELRSRFVDREAITHDCDATERSRAVWMRAKPIPLACNPVNHVYTPTSD